MSAPLRKKPGALPERSSLKTLLSVALVVLVYIWSSASLGVSPGKFVSGDTWRNMSDLVIRMGPFFRINRCSDAQQLWGPNPDPEIIHAKQPDPAKVAAVCEQEQTLYFFDKGLISEQIDYARTTAWKPLAETFRMAILGAFFGALAAIPFSLLAAGNLVRSKAVYYAVRGFLNLIRTIPDLVWAAICSGVFGIGALPGVVALAIFSFALIAKLTSESVEAIDPGPLEATQATGANRLQQISFSVVPQVLPQFIAYVIYVLEVNVRASAILGWVGAGGIGQLLNEELTYMRFRNLGAVVVLLLVVVVIMDFISSKLRERLV